MKFIIGTPVGIADEVSKLDFCCAGVGPMLSNLLPETFGPMFGAAMVPGLLQVLMVAMRVLAAWKPSFIAPFFLKPVAPHELTTLDITKGAMPFIGLQAVALALVYIFPGLALWLPAAIGW